MSMIKKVIYRQKHPLFVISGGNYRADVHRIRSAPPPDVETLSHQISELVIETPKEKGLILKTEGGKVLTQEDLDNFVDSSSEEESSSENETIVDEKSKDKLVDHKKTSVKIEKSDESDDKIFNKEEQAIKNEVIESIKEKIREEIKEEVKEAIKNEVEREIRETKAETMKGNVYKFEFPKEIAAEEPARIETSVKSSGIYQIPTLTTPKTVYKKIDEGLSRKHLLQNRIKRFYSIDEILFFKERKTIPLIYERSLFKKTELSESEKLEGKVYDVVALFRRECNRVAKSNMDKVLKEIKRLTVKTIEEMTEIADFIFEKAVREVAYQDLYIQIIKALKTTFFSQKEIEDKKKGSAHSVFWTEICHQCKDTFINKENWSYEVSIKENAQLTVEERYKYEEELEEKEGEKIKKKGRILGTIRLLANFFINGMISDNFILTIINNLKAKLDNQENVEIICSLLDHCGEKFMKKNVALFNEVISILKSNMDTYHLRVKFIVQDLIDEKIPNWKTETKKTSALFPKNKFSGILFLEEEESRKEPERIAYDVLFKNIKNALQDEGSDLNLLRQNTIKEIKKGSNSEFLYEFFSYVCENFDLVDELINFFLQMVNMFTKKEILDSLNETFILLEELKWDAPFAYSNFYKVLIYLQSDAILLDDDLNEFKADTYEEERVKIIKQWLSDYNNYNLRLERVCKKDEIVNILNEHASGEERDRFKDYLEKYELI